MCITKKLNYYIDKEKIMVNRLIFIISHHRVLGIRSNKHLNLI